MKGLAGFQRASPVVAGNVMSGKNVHEIRDPIHTFIRLDTAERRVVDSRPFQRLRHIHQLAMTYLVYPGATHRRFEHSLGVMDLAGRVYDVVTETGSLHDKVRAFVPRMGSFEHTYWRRAVRMAALCHDLGHLPFSHAAEKELLPNGWDHERLTLEIIRSEEMQRIWQDMKLTTDDVAKLAIGPKKLPDIQFSDWETILSEIISGDAFGVDRMDYLLRDSFHAGVAYGSFDRHRLIDTLRILPREDQESNEPSLGIEEGGLQSTEALLLARYFMYQQVYFHPVRRVYDIHLQDFLKAWLPDGRFSTDLDDHLLTTDAEITVAYLKAAADPSSAGYDAACHIVNRTHFKVLYQRNPADQAQNAEAAKAVFHAASEKFGAGKVRLDHYRQKGGPADFPVLTRDGRIASSLSLSDALNKIPVVAVDYIFVDRSAYDEAVTWLKEHRRSIITQSHGEAE